VAAESLIRWQLVRFRVRYDDPAELVRDGDEQFERGGFLVRVEPPDGAELFSPVELAVAWGGREVVQPGQIVQMVPGIGVAIGFSASAALRGLVDRARKRPAGGGPAQHGGANTAGGHAPTEQVPATAHARFQAADKPERIKMARYGNKDERMQALRSGTRALHRFVLQNPGLGLDEVVFIAKMTTTAPDVLEAIAKRREWAQRPEVALALVRNPKMPVPLAIQLLRHVAPSDLQQLARGTSLRMPILQAVRKRVLQR